MGGNESKTPDPDEDQIKKEVNKFYYYSRFNKNLYKVECEKVTKLKVKGKIKIYDNSAIAYASRDNIVVIGGSNWLGKLTNKAFLIDCSDRKAHEFESAPKNTKEGCILVDNKTLYFVGSTIESNEHCGAIQGGPIMIYSVKERDWNIIPYDRISKSEFFSLTSNEKTIDELDLEEINFNLNSLISPGAFLLDNRIYLIGGKIFDGADYSPSNKVFSLGIHKWDLRLEPFTLPVNLTNPQCVSKGTNTFIVGGNLDDGKPNLDVFIYKSKSNSILKYGVSFETKLEDYYPPQVVFDDFVFLSYPKFWIKPKGTKDLNSYTIKKVSENDYYSVTRTFKHTSTPIEAQYIEVKTHAFLYVDFTITNGDYISDPSANIIPFLQKRVVDLASTAFHVGENLNIVVNPTVSGSATSRQQVNFQLNGKTAVFIIQCNLIHCESYSVDFDKIIEAKEPDTPSHWIKPVSVNKVHYTNWSKTVIAKKVWTTAPRNFEETTSVCNWAADHGYLIRPKGIMHGWSPLTISNHEEGKVLLVDLTKYPDSMKFYSNSAYGPVVTVSAGTTMGELMTYLEQQEGPGDAPGWSFPHITAPAHLTVGGVLAINGHGSGIPCHSEKFKVSYGSLSNHVVELWAVVTDPQIDPHKYVVKKFDRHEKDTKAFLAHLGRTVVLQVTLKVIPNYNLRCQSITHLDYKTLFAAPINGVNPENSLGQLVEQKGRVEIIWFPFTDFPWTKVWSHEPKLPVGSVKVDQMNNYPFSDHYPDYITEMLKKIHSVPEITPKFCSLLGWVPNFSLQVTNKVDIWGPSKNTLIYVRDQTIRVTANGYAIHMNKNYIQQASHYLGMKFDKMTKKYSSQNKWPINFPLEIRITGLDKNEFIFEDSHDEFNRPVISALAYTQLDKEKGWDVAMWFDVLTLPNTKHSDEFFEVFEKWLIKTFNNDNAKTFVEWSKGWAYSAKHGPWTSTEVIQDIRKNFSDHRNDDDNWEWEKTTLQKYDGRNIYFSGLNRTLFT